MDVVKCRVKKCRYNKAGNGAELGECSKFVIDVNSRGICVSYEESERSKINV